MALPREVIDAALVALQSGQTRVLGRVAPGPFSTMLKALLLLLSLLNADRHGHGVAALRIDPRLAAVAQWRSQDMAHRHTLSHHIPPTGELVFSVLDQRHIPYQTAGENIACNDFLTVESLSQTIRDTNRAWMQSPDHRANILDPAFTRVGLGLARTPQGDLYATEDFAG